MVKIKMESRLLLYKCIRFGCSYGQFNLATVLGFLMLKDQVQTSAVQLLVRIDSACRSTCSSGELQPTRHSTAFYVVCPEAVLSSVCVCNLKIRD